MAGFLPSPLQGNGPQRLRALRFAIFKRLFISQTSLHGQQIGLALSFKQFLLIMEDTTLLVLLFVYFFDTGYHLVQVGFNPAM